MISKRLIKIITLLLVSQVPLYSGSIDYLSNQSADNARGYRGAAIDGADIVTYNPAGTAMMIDALYVQLNHQTIFKDYSVTSSTNGKYKSTYPTPMLPSAFAVYKQDSWAAFTGFTCPAGGGTLKYNDGLPIFYELEPLHGSGLDPDSMWFEGSSAYYAGTIGGAYAVNKMISLSIGLRYTYSQKTYKGEARYSDGLAEIDSKKTASGGCGIFGLFVLPTDGLRIGLRYEMETPLEYETKTEKQTFDTTGFVGALKQFDDGHKEKRNLPAILGLGISYVILSNFSVSLSAIYYFIQQADKNDDIEGTLLEPRGVVVGYDDDYDNGIELGASIEYSLLPDLMVSFIYNYNDTGANEDTFSSFEYTLDAHTFGIGVKYNISDDLYLTFGFGRSNYIEGENSDGSEKYNKTVHAFAVGIQYRIPAE